MLSSSTGWAHSAAGVSCGEKLKLILIKMCRDGMFIIVLGLVFYKTKNKSAKRNLSHFTLSVLRFEKSFISHLFSLEICIFLVRVVLLVL